MIAVIFEAWPASGEQRRYLDLAAALLPGLDEIDGFLSIERFESLAEPGKLLSLSFWRDEAAIGRWRNTGEHRATQAAGRHGVFTDYRLRIAEVARDYGITDRAQAPVDSLEVHDRKQNSATQVAIIRRTAFEEQATDLRSEKIGALAPSRRPA